MKGRPKERLTTRWYRILVSVEWAVNIVLFGLTMVVRSFNHSRHRSGRLLLSRVDSIGDMVMFSACLPAYRSLFKDYRITMLVTDQVRDIVEGCPFVDELWFLNTRRFRRNPVERLRWWWKLLTSRFDLAVNPVYSMSFTSLDCLIGWTGARKRVAHQCLDEPSTRFRPFPFHTELAPATSEWKFEIDRNFDLLQYLGYRDEVERKTWVWPSMTAATFSAFPKGHSDDESCVVVCPGSRVSEKIWPAENYAAVIRFVATQHPTRWLICGNSREHSMCDRILDLAGRETSMINLAGKLSLIDLVDVISKSDLCIGNDSAPIHLAATTGTPGICILGGGHHGRFYPYPGNPRTVAISHPLPCYHCYWNCVLDEPECVTRIAVEDVAEAVLRTLATAKKQREFHAT